VTDTPTETPTPMTEPGSSDTETPTPEPPGPCDGLTGAAQGLCNAFCVAQDCPNNPDQSCEMLRRNFALQTGSSTFPCEN
jgi:hypothetical protein